jgi:hypothetical protein
MFCSAWSSASMPTQSTSLVSGPVVAAGGVGSGLVEAQPHGAGLQAWGLGDGVFGVDAVGPARGCGVRAGVVGDDVWVPVDQVQVDGGGSSTTSSIGSRAERDRCPRGRRTPGTSAAGGHENAVRTRRGEHGRLGENADDLLDDVDELFRTSSLGRPARDAYELADEVESRIDEPELCRRRGCTCVVARAAP